MPAVLTVQIACPENAGQLTLEGPCCAGKTTLRRLLAKELRGLAVTFVPCYADHAGGGR